MTMITSDMPTELLRITRNGLYCPLADIYIDPQRKVDKAVITHAHADHARRGMGSYACHPYTAAVLRSRYGKKIRTSEFPYGKGFTTKGVRVSFHPAGHVPGASQIRIEYKGEVWVVTGDIKPGDDGLTTPYEPVRCDGLIIESTFALPVYHWKPQAAVLEEIRNWWQMNLNLQRLPVIIAYSFGKAQRLVHLLSHGGLPFRVHPNIEATSQALREAGLDLPACDTVDVASSVEEISGNILILPASSHMGKWKRIFGPLDLAMASGWMQLRGNNRSPGSMKGFVLSDHADWGGLNCIVEESRAEKVIVTHGYEDVFVRWLREKGLEAYRMEDLTSAMRNSES